MRRPAVLLSAALSACALTAQADGDAARAVVRRHAEHSFRLHGECAERAVLLQKRVGELLAAPAAATLAAARSAWIDAHAVYCEVEALRFSGGPIDAVEPLLNAWPVDEAYIDAVVGNPAAGIVHDRDRYRALSAPLLEHANERGGETNVSVGWHAIEFLLWGQDLDADGPGQRPFSDFVDGVGVAADRRRAYLRIATDLLVGHLAALHDAWAPGRENYRRQFEADPASALRSMLTGAAILSAFELAGERLAVAYETQDQEQEHSCFSDTTCQDLVADQRGIVAVFAGGRADGDATLLGLIRAKDAALADHLERRLAASLAALQAIPQPFDRAFRGADDAPGRQAILAAIQALEQQAEAIAIAGQLLGYTLPMRPGQ